MSEQITSATEETDTSTQQHQAEEKTFTQAEVNAMMAKTKSQLEKKFASKYEDLGDPDFLREIVSKHQKMEQEQQLKRGEFDRVIQDITAKKNAEIDSLRKTVEEFKLNTPIIDAAARHRSVNPEQVKALVRNNLRLNEEGEVEVLDDKGQVRYDSNGSRLTVDNLVQEFLQKNPHFSQPTPSTTATRSNVGPGQTTVDLNKLDMSNPEHRKIYAAQRKSR